MRKILECVDPTVAPGKRFLFLCPGCGYGHHVVTPQWSWNGSVESPTFNPSVLTGSPGFNERRCHSFVKDGKIQFLADCHHSLANMTVDLPDLDSNDELDYSFPPQTL